LFILQNWTDETVSYRCRSSKKLFWQSDGTGIDSMTVECVHFGNIGAWWEPKVLPICAENLTGNYLQI
jgi:hypothetical protein